MKNKETLEEASLRIGLMEIELNHIKTLLASCEKALENRDNQAKRMYSEEEVRNIIFKFSSDFDTKRNIEITLEEQKQWFEQFKKEIKE
jgi:hypothetical protein